MLLLILMLMLILILMLVIKEKRDKIGNRNYVDTIDRFF